MMRRSVDLNDLNISPHLRLVRQGHVAREIVAPEGLNISLRPARAPFLRLNRSLGGEESGRGIYSSAIVYSG